MLLLPRGVVGVTLTDPQTRLVNRGCWWSEVGLREQQMARAEPVSERGNVGRPAAAVGRRGAVGADLPGSPVRLCCSSTKCQNLPRDPRTAVQNTCCWLWRTKLLVIINLFYNCRPLHVVKKVLVIFKKPGHFWAHVVFSKGICFNSQVSKYENKILGNGKVKGVTPSSSCNYHNI